MKTLLKLCFVALLALAFVGSVSTTDLAVAQSDSTGPWAKYGGVWQSGHGPVTVKFEGNKASGSWKGGSFEGLVDQRGHIKYKWKASNNTKGVGIFMIQKNGTIIGTWGYGSSNNNGGEWKLHR